jgi:hypothetical protein
MSLQKRWKNQAPTVPSTTAAKHIAGIHEEKHFTPPFLASLWGLSADFVHKLFEHEDGVIKVLRPEDPNAVVNRERKTKGPRGKRRYLTLRIPESIAVRVHERLHGKVTA